MGLFKWVKDETVGFVKQKITERKVYQKTYRDERINAMERKARIDAQKIVTQARQNAQHSAAPIKKATSSLFEAYKKNREQNLKHGIPLARR